MKNVITWVSKRFILLLFFVLAANNVYSQDPPNCNPECTSPWMYTIISGPISVPGCPDCAITDLSIRFRDCSPYFDYQILSYKISAGCSGCQDIWIHTAVHHWLVEHGPLGLPPEGQCLPFYRVSEAGCWQLVGNTMTPCPDVTDCCWKLYMVCNNGNGNVTSSLIGSSNSFILCTSPCRTFCTVPTREPIFNEELNKELAEKFGCNSYSTPNPSTVSTEIHFVSNYKGGLKVAIYDLDGHLLYNSDLIKGNEELTVPVNLDKFISGSYLYQIYTDDGLVCKGNFIVNK